MQRCVLLFCLVLPAVPAGAQQPTTGGDSWWWVHGGVSIQVMGNFSDWATSWKQPEANAWLAEPRGPYRGTFYRTATVRKVGFSAGLAAASYLIAWKWPKARKYVAGFNIAAGGAFAGVAVSNTLRNPYYKPTPRD